MLTDGLGLDSPSEIEKRGLLQRLWRIARSSCERKPGTGNARHA